VLRFFDNTSIWLNAWVLNVNTSLPGSRLYLTGARCIWRSSVLRVEMTGTIVVGVGVRGARVRFGKLVVRRSGV
jgi:hypothetical protein